MAPAPLPANEAERLRSLHSYDVLDTACEQAFDNIARLAARLTDSPIALISLIDEDRQWFKARIGLQAAETPREAAFCAHTILEPGKPLVVRDARSDPRFADNPLVTGSPDIRFYAGVPLMSLEGFALGALCVIGTEPRDIDPATLELLAGLAQTAETTLELRRSVREVRHMAMTDTLTGLPNRPAFLETMEQAIARQMRDGGPFSLVYLDLDGFKRVNDAQGHAQGDLALKAVARALRGAIRREDTAARIGGDEFAVLLTGGDGSEAATVSERVRRAIKDTMDDGGWPVTASVGAASFMTPPEDAMEALEMADILMYRAKSAGKNRVRHLDVTDAIVSGPLH